MRTQKFCESRIALLLVFACLTLTAVAQGNDPHVGNCINSNVRPEVVIETLICFEETTSLQASPAQVKRIERWRESQRQDIQAIALIHGIALQAVNGEKSPDDAYGEILKQRAGICQRKNFACKAFPKDFQEALTERFRPTNSFMPIAVAADEFFKEVSRAQKLTQLSPVVRVLWIRKIDTELKRMYVRRSAPVLSHK